MNALLNRLQAALTDDLRRPPWRGSPNSMAGHCYVACEALYHLLGGKETGWKPCFIRHEESPHWFLKNASGTVLDPTASQFSSPPDYAQGIGKGFLTKKPSKRAKKVLEKLEKL